MCTVDILSFGKNMYKVVLIGSIIHENSGLDNWEPDVEKIIKNNLGF